MKGTRDERHALAGTTLGQLRSQANRNAKHGEKAKRERKKSKMGANGVSECAMVRDYKAKNVSAFRLTV